MRHPLCVFEAKNNNEDKGKCRGRRKKDAFREELVSHGQGVRRRCEADGPLLKKRLIDNVLHPWENERETWRGRITAQTEPRRRIHQPEQ